MSATTGLSPLLLARIRDVFGRYPEVPRAVIYGCRAMSSYKPGSDIDLEMFADDIISTRFAGLWSELGDLRGSWRRRIGNAWSRSARMDASRGSAMVEAQRGETSERGSSLIRTGSRCALA
jgi:hypothetical protein